MAGKLRERAPQVEIRVVDRPPVVGAALLGMDALGASPAAEARLREALLERTGASRSDGPVLIAARSLEGCLRSFHHLPFASSPSDFLQSVISLSRARMAQSSDRRKPICQ